MTIAQSELDAIAHALDRANAYAIRAGMAARRGDMASAADQTDKAQQAAARGYKDAMRAGATPPDDLPEPRPLAIALMDTPANRNLLACLLATYEAARMVDIERGHNPADGFAAIIESYCADVRDEIGGPVGGGRE